MGNSQTERRAEASSDAPRGANQNLISTAPPQDPHDDISASSGRSSSRRAVVEEAKCPATDARHANPSRLARRERRKNRKRRKAYKEAKAKQQWKIFSDLDTRDEAEMLQLAVFLQTLIDYVPGASEAYGSSRDLLAEDEDDDVEEDKTDRVKLRAFKFQVDRPNGASNVFVLPKKGRITAYEVMQIIEVYRQGGTLCENSVQKILRQSWKRLKESRNVTKVSIDDRQVVVVVGDLHGQLADLLHILDQAGMPSESVLYVFNGDFVDRGPFGVEVICLLLALYVAMPNSVFLNRGNHEDQAICYVYGFQRECKAKYMNELILAMFMEVFRYLPLFTIVGDELFIVHGGLFHDANVLIGVLDLIDRTDYNPKPAIPFPEVTEGMDSNGRRLEYLKQLQRDALWSDPQPSEGSLPNTRGAGVLFGPDVTQRFLRNNNLSMVVRSHEAARNGFDLPYAETCGPILATIFSASNYCGIGNQGAYMVFSRHPPSSEPEDSTRVGSLFYKVFRYKTSDAAKSLEAQNELSLHGLVFKKKTELLQEFRARDLENTGTVTTAVWAEVMLAITQLQILWLATVSILVPDECITSDGDHIIYHLFLRTFSLRKPARNSEEKDTEVMLDTLYANRSKLETIFHFFDTDGNGNISREEFHKGCAALNETLPPDLKLTDCDKVLDMMDFDRNNVIDLNEFFEAFRIMDGKDGNLDGEIGMGVAKVRSYSTDNSSDNDSVNSANLNRDAYSASGESDSDNEGFYPDIPEIDTPVPTLVDKPTSTHPDTLSTHLNTPDTSVHVTIETPLANPESSGFRGLLCYCLPAWDWEPESDEALF